MCLLRGTKLIFICNSLHVSFERANAAPVYNQFYHVTYVQVPKIPNYLCRDTELFIFLINQLSESKYSHLGLLRYKY